MRDRRHRQLHGRGRDAARQIDFDRCRIAFEHGRPVHAGRSNFLCGKRAEDVLRGCRADKTQCDASIGLRHRQADANRGGTGRADIDPRRHSSVRQRLPRQRRHGKRALAVRYRARESDGEHPPFDRQRTRRAGGQRAESRDAGDRDVERERQPARRGEPEPQAGEAARPRPDDEPRQIALLGPGLA